MKSLNEDIKQGQFKNIYLLYGEEDYLKKQYIPKAVESGFLQRPCLRRVMQAEEGEGISFSVQFHVKNVDTLNFWLQNEGNNLHRALVARFGHKIAGFSTLLEEIDWEK